ncbi:hypothetical protein RRG08_031293 [Elysia crispata]|uniref:Uncharacterized protein n=1 Tax=Elysia crispata TaxID=231223 RepID=A0AAE1AL20_9GAST|nr:hypothetical protein RRG08_031293 [Elysia crispata]
MAPSDRKPAGHLVSSCVFPIDDPLPALLIATAVIRAPRENERPAHLPEETRKPTDVAGMLNDEVKRVLGPGEKVLSVEGQRLFLNDLTLGGGKLDRSKRNGIKTRDVIKG